MKKTFNVINTLKLPQKTLKLAAGLPIFRTMTTFGLFFYNDSVKYE